MDWLAPVVFTLILTGVVLGGIASRRIRIGPLVYWFAGWGFVIVTVTALTIPVQREKFEMLAGYLTPVFPTMMLAGAYRYAGRAVPRFIIPCGVVLCVLVGTWTAEGMTGRAGALSLLVEPLMCLVAAGLVFRSGGTRRTVLQGLLAPSLVVIATIESLDALNGILRWQLWSLPMVWILAGLPLAALHFSVMLELVAEELALTTRERDEHALALAQKVDELRESHRLMERRVEERTAQLAEEVQERRRAEETLRISEEHYRKVSSLMADYNYAARVDASGKVHIEWLAGAVEQTTGYDHEEARDLDWFAITHPDDRPEAQRSLAAALRGGVEEFRCRIITKAGDIRWIQGRVMGERDEETGEVIIYTAGHDITEEMLAELENQKLRESVREAQRLESLGALASGVAHDFNNLLSVILGNAAILNEQLPDDSPLRSRAQRIRSSARIASEITTQMLTYAGGASLSTEPLDLSKLVEDMAELVDAGTTQRVRMESDLSHTLPMVMGDASQIRQVVLNLITNACEALGEGGGQITLRTQVGAIDLDRSPELAPLAEAGANAFVSLEVVDDGPGMDEETQARVFEPFFSTKFSGRGLGLAVVHGIVRSHGGVIRVESGLGAGTSFRVLLPALPARATSQTRGPDADQEGVSAAGCHESTEPAGTVLIVDDDEAVSELAEIFLTRAGFHVLLAGGGCAGLELYDEHCDRISVVVLDLSMPDLPGEQVLSELRLRNPSLPVLVSSGYTNTIAAQRIGHPEHTAFIQKPCEPEDLVQRVRGLLREGDQSDGPG